MLSLLLASLLLVQTPPTYSAVVVDATTNKPLANVSVRATGSKDGTTTDAHGIFKLGGSPTQLDFALLGYSALHLAVPAQPTSADTLRLLPTSYVLDAVTIRPPKVVTFSSVPKEGAEMGRRLLPGQSVALLLERPASAPADKPCMLSEVRIYLQDKVKEGRLRVRLVDIQGSGTSARPGSNDLLPAPSVYSTEQLRAAPKGVLLVDVSQYGLLLPAEGLCVVVDCLPTDPADQDIKVTNDGKGHSTVTLATAAGAASHNVPGDDYPSLESRRGVGLRTWSRFPARPEWTTRANLFYTVHTDVSVYTY